MATWQHQEAQAGRVYTCKTDIQRGCWKILFTTNKNKIYYVRRVCATCMHFLRCTCLDYAIWNLVCCHIHAINLTETPEEPRNIPFNATDDMNIETNEIAFKEKRKLEHLKWSTMAELTDSLQSAQSKETIQYYATSVQPNQLQGDFLKWQQSPICARKIIPPRNLLAKRQKRFFLMTTKSHHIRNYSL